MSKSGLLWSKRGGNVFIGEYQCKLDSKGRITLPSKFREMLESFYLLRGTDNSISLYPIEVFEKMVKGVKESNLSNMKKARLGRILFSTATQLECDGQGRINIPNQLLDYACIKKEVVVTGNNEIIEIWDKDKWNIAIQEAIEDFSEINEELNF